MWPRVTRTARRQSTASASDRDCSQVSETLRTLQLVRHQAQHSDNTVIELFQEWSP